MGSLADQLGVCSWSLEPETPAQLIERMGAVGLRKMQLALDPLREDGRWRNAGKQLADAGLEVVGGMMRCVGEDYTTPATIRRTGGVVPDETWPQTWGNMQRMAQSAMELGLKYVAFHAGFLPDDPNDLNFNKLLDRLARIADHFAAAGMEVGFETGQEDAPALLRFLDVLGKPNVVVNFDPANMILYDKGDPIEALGLLAPRLRQCHLKDALPSTTPSQWGQESVVGAGIVDWRAFFGVLRDHRFAGPMLIEREWGQQRVADIRAGKEHALKVLKNWDDPDFSSCSRRDNR